MKGKICSGLLLLLSIMVGSLLSVSSTYSLAHDYNGILFMNSEIPTHLTEIDGRQSIDWNYDFTQRGTNFYSTQYDHGFRLYAYGTAFDSSYSGISLKNTLAFMKIRYNPSSDQCVYDTGYSSPILNWNLDSDSFSVISNPDFYFFDNRVPNFQFNQSAIRYSTCFRRSSFGQPPQPQFAVNNLPSGMFNCGNSSGTTCQGMQDFRSFVNTEFLPNYWFSSDGFYVHSHAIDTDSGVHYNHSFSFKDLFTQNITKFSHLYLPLFSYDNYWLDSSNFYQGRHLEWRGVFEFDGNFEWNPNLPSNSFFRIMITGQETSSQTRTLFADCTTNLRTVPDLGVTHLEYSCPIDLSYNFAWIYPVLQIYGGSIDGVTQYVWETDDDWYFGQQLLITDYDETPGQSFNSELHGNNIPGEALPDSSSDLNWFSSLTLMFDFSAFNPFAGIFNLFTHSDNCVQIPILAGMLHAQESTYCSWFPSSVRSVLTPVFGLSSVMLIFGFFIRWLNGSSGNFFEDAGHLEPPGTSAQNGTVSKHGWRRIK